MRKSKHLPRRRCLLIPLRGVRWLLRLATAPGDTLPTLSPGDWNGLTYISPPGDKQVTHAPGQDWACLSHGLELLGEGMPWPWAVTLPRYQLLPLQDRACGRRTEPEGAELKGVGGA